MTHLAILPVLLNPHPPARRTRPLKMTIPNEPRHPRLTLTLALPVDRYGAVLRALEGAVVRALLYLNLQRVIPCVSREITRAIAGL